MISILSLQSWFLNLPNIALCCVFSCSLNSQVFIFFYQFCSKKMSLDATFTQKMTTWELRPWEKKNRKFQPKLQLSFYEIIRSFRKKKSSRCWRNVKKGASNYICFQQLSLLNALFTSWMLWDFLATNPTYCKGSLVREFQVYYIFCII